METSHLISGFLAVTDLSPGIFNYAPVLICSVKWHNDPYGMDKMGNDRGKFSSTIHSFAQTASKS